jgi:hypothetical protein
LPGSITKTWSIFNRVGLICFWDITHKVLLHWK